jgi:CHAT domain-containing protein
LLVVGEGVLQYIPFGSLPAPAAGREKKRPLLVDHEVVSLPSASVLAVLRKELAARKPAPRAVAVLADPVFSTDDPRVKIAQQNRATKTDDVIAATEVERSARESGVASLSRLRFSRQEADAIAALFSSSKSLKAIDFEANRSTAVSPDIAEYRIVHFATHVLINSQHPELSGVVLSLVDAQGRTQDGFLRLHEIYNLRLGADLVVLSACQTALGKEVKGEGLIGLTRGFMYAGAPRVVASLWSVEDRATAELMKRFYRAMGRGMTAAGALRAAQVEMWKVGGWEDPFYWGGFVLQGEWRK